MFLKLFSILLLTGMILGSKSFYKWIDKDSKANESEFYRSLIPAGKVGYWNANICRVQLNGHFVPGALHQRPYRSASCTVYENHQLQNISNFEALESSPECLAWVPVTNRNELPDRAFPIGHHQDGSVAYSCRYLNAQGHLLPGKYGHFPGRGGSCWYTYDKQEHRADSQVEVLTLSVYGEQYCNKS